jgi:hypothetical protein
VSAGKTWSGMYLSLLSSRLERKGMSSVAKSEAMCVIASIADIVEDSK